MIAKLSAPAVLFSLLCLGGCASQVNLGSWQKSLETYVKTDGRGDPNVLRDLTWKSTHRGFSQIGGPQPAQSSDANGVLLGHRGIADRPWFIFIVGLIDKQKVYDIRLAALSVVNDNYTWKVSHKNADVFKRYHAYNENLWHQRFPGRKSAPPEYLGFPREEDTFDIEAADNHITVTHPPSGARWELDISK